MKTPNCPLLGLQPCVRENCVMYLHTESITVGDGQPVPGNLFAVLPGHPCALLMAGTKAAFDILRLEYQVNDEE